MTKNCSRNWLKKWKSKIRLSPTETNLWRSCKLGSASNRNRDLEGPCTSWETPQNRKKWCTQLRTRLARCSLRPSLTRWIAHSTRPLLATKASTYRTSGWATAFLGILGPELGAYPSKIWFRIHLSSHQDPPWTQAQPSSMSASIQIMTIFRSSLNNHQKATSRWFPTWKRRPKPGSKNGKITRELIQLALKRPWQFQRHLAKILSLTWQPTFRTCTSIRWLINNNRPAAQISYRTTFRTSRARIGRRRKSGLNLRSK